MIGIVGGSGFIGTVLARTLSAEGRPVRLIDRAPSRAYPERWRPADVRDLLALSAAVAGCTTLYHLAAEHRDDVRPATRYHDVNVRGAEHLCAAAEAHRIERILFVSSVAVYGAADHELDEAAPLRPYSEYGRSKVAAEQVFCRWAARAPGRSLTIIRPTVVFGPGNRGNVFELIAQIARGRTIVIGDGCNRKSLAYVENLADFLVHALRFGPGSHVYNYADKPDPDMNGLVTLDRGGARRRPRAAAAPSLWPRARGRPGLRPPGAPHRAQARRQRGAYPQVCRHDPVRQCPLSGIRIHASTRSARRPRHHHPARVRSARGIRQATCLLRGQGRRAARDVASCSGLGPGADPLWLGNRAAVR